MLTGESSLDILYPEIFGAIFTLALLMSLKSIILTGVNLSSQISNLISSDGISYAYLDSLFDLKQLAFSRLKEPTLYSLLHVTLQKFLTFTFYKLSSMMIGAAIFIMIITADLLMSILCVSGPLLISLNGVPFCSEFLSKWSRGFVSSLFWVPLAYLYTTVALLINVIEMDISI